MMTKAPIRIIPPINEPVSKRRPPLFFGALVVVVVVVVCTALEDDGGAVDEVTLTDDVGVDVPFLLIGVVALTDDVWVDVPFCVVALTVATGFIITRLVVAFRDPFLIDACLDREGVTDNKDTFEFDFGVEIDGFTDAEVWENATCPMCKIMNAINIVNCMVRTRS